MSDEVIVVHRDRLYIPIAAVDARALRALLEVPYQTKAHCHPQCPFAQKPGRFCSTCPGRDARIYLWSRVTTPNGHRLVAIAGGDRGVLDRVVIGRYRIVDRRSDVPFRSSLRWTGKLRRGEIVRGRPTADQHDMLSSWRRSVRSGQSGGVVISPPRSGKTVIGVSAAMSERTRTFITASKIDFLRQFGKRFGELTNLRELYARGQRPVVLIDPRGWPDGPDHGVYVLKKWKPEVDRADVVMSCFQQFLDTRGGHERMRRYLTSRFGLAVGDEIHQSAAAQFSRLMNRLDTRRKLGLTATISRKDGTQNVVLRTVGPVVAKGNAASDLPHIELWETGIGSSRKYSSWHHMTQFLVGLEEHNVAIVRQCFKDLRSDRRHCVLITTTRKAHIALLVKMINAQAAYCNQNKDEQWPGELAMGYQGKTDTASVLKLAGNGRVRVVVAMVSMVQYGLDIMRWTHVYIGAVPTSNVYNTYQLVNRVCTPYDEHTERRLGPKPQSVARIMIHALSQSVFCYAKLFKAGDFGFEAGLSSRNYFGVPLYAMRAETLERAREIASAPRAYDPVDAGVNVSLGKTRTGKRRRKNAWTARKGGVTEL